MIFNLEAIIFCVFSFLLVFAAMMVIFSKNSVTSILYLVYAFFNAAVLWMLLHAEFLSLVLIFVYVGAVMTLFLFVVMMIRLNLEEERYSFSKIILFAIVALVLICATLLIATHTLASLKQGAFQFHFVENISALGHLLYTVYAYPTELAAVLLLTAIIAAITLSHTRDSKRQSQDIAKQVAANKKERLHIIQDKALE